MGEVRHMNEDRDAHFDKCAAELLEQFPNVNGYTKRVEIAENFALRVIYEEILFLPKITGDQSDARP